MKMTIIVLGIFASVLLIMTGFILSIEDVPKEKYLEECNEAGFTHYDNFFYDDEKNFTDIECYNHQPHEVIRIYDN